jgi:hypothetical protein
MSNFGLGMGLCADEHELITVGEVFAMDNEQFRNYVIIVTNDLCETDKEIVRMYLMRMRLISSTVFTPG